MKHRVMIVVFLSSLYFFVGPMLCVSWAADPVEPENVVLTKAAWDAFNDGKYDQAISKADECLKKFEGQAILEQEKLEKDKAPQPAEGSASKEATETIHKRGLLNDVATCLFIKGESYEEQQKYLEGKAAYEKAAKLTYARTWDPKGWFWSPAKASEGRLKTLPKASK
jgi:tetratricopeptide (TPR) repeat protein